MANKFVDSYDPNALEYPAKIKLSDVKLWDNNQINQHLFDRWSVVHAGFGVYLGWHGMGLIPLLLVHSLFEWYENAYLKAKFPEAFPHPSIDTAYNSLGDTIAIVAGWALNWNDSKIKNKLWGLPDFTSWREFIGGEKE